MKKELKISPYDEYSKLSHCVTHAFISLFLLILPLSVTDAYFNITETKLITFYILASAYLIAQLFVFSIYFATNGKAFLKSLDFNLNFLDVAFILLGVAYIVSGIFSPYSASDVVFGIGSRYQGILTVFLYIILYFVLTRTFSFSPWCLFWAGIGFSFVSLVAVLNGFSVDPLGFYMDLSAINKSRYLSTIGNVNFYSAYYNIIFPILIVGFCKAIDKKSLISFGSFVFIGSVGMLFTASESFLFGFLFAMVLLLLFFMDDVKALKRFIGACLLFIVTITGYVNLFKLTVFKDVLNFSPSDLMKIIAEPVISFSIIILMSFILIISVKKPDLLPILKRIFTIIFVITVLGGVILVLLLNTVFKNIDIGTFEEYLKFSPEWGTNRGQNWIFCVNEFIKAPLKFKIFGYGPETYRHLTADTGFYATKSLDQVHNEYLHYLITTGVFGLFSYLSIIYVTVRNSLKNIRNNAVAVSVLCGLIAYWIQAFVNIAQPFTTPIMFVLIAVLSKLCVLEKHNAK